MELALMGGSWATDPVPPPPLRGGRHSVAIVPGAGVSARKCPKQKTNCQTSKESRLHAADTTGPRILSLTEPQGPGSVRNRQHRDARKTLSALIVLGAANRVPPSLRVLRTPRINSLLANPAQ